MTSDNFSAHIHKLDRLIFELNTALFATADPQLTKEFSLSIKEEDGLKLTSAPRIPHPYLNNIFGIGMNAPITRERFDALIAQHPEKMLTIIPSPLPAQLTDWLRELGYIDAVLATAHRYEAEPLKTPETSLRIERLSDDERADFTQVCTQVGLLSEFAPLAGVEQARFEPWFAGLVRQPGCHVYVAYAGETPIATGVLFTSNQSAYLAFAGTLPSHRGLGAQSALIARRVQDALAMGCRDIFVGTGASKADVAANVHHTSQSNLYQMGFRTIGTVNFWVRLPS